MTDLVELLRSIAANRPEGARAVVDGNSELSFLELAKRVQESADWLGSLKIEVLALHGENSVNWVVMDLACQKAGIVCLPLPKFFSEEQINRCLNEAGVNLILSDQVSFPERLARRKALTALNQHCEYFVWRTGSKKTAQGPKGTQKITFTSGSSGAPKGVCLSFEHQWTVAKSLADVIDIENPKHLCLLPLSTLLENIAGVYSPLLSGGCVVTLNDKQRGLSGSSGLDLNALLECIVRVQPNTMILIPQLLTALVAACSQGWVPPSSLKFVAVGGGKVSPELIVAAHQYKLPVYQGYGLSECASVVALNTPGDTDLHSVGRVLPHCSVSLESGEIVISGANHLGYLGNAESWYPTKIYSGDMGYLENENLCIEGRKKNILITSFGRNVNPEWIESELMSAPLLSQCIVFGDAMPFLCALLSAPAHVSDEDITRWIEKVNVRLPDYARIGSWQRLASESLNLYATANGRLQRSKVEQAFSEIINNFYSGCHVNGHSIEEIL